MLATIVSLYGLGVVIFVVYILFLEPFCHLFGATDLTLTYTTDDYGGIIAIGMI